MKHRNDVRPARARLIPTSPPCSLSLLLVLATGCGESCAQPRDARSPAEVSARNAPLSVSVRVRAVDAATGAECRDAKFGVADATTGASIVKHCDSPVRFERAPDADPWIVAAVPGYEPAAVRCSDSAAEIEIAMNPCTRFADIGVTGDIDDPSAARLQITGVVRGGDALPFSCKTEDYYAVTKGMLSATEGVFRAPLPSGTFVRVFPKVEGSFVWPAYLFPRRDEREVVHVESTRTIRVSFQGSDSAPPGVRLHLRQNRLRDPGGEDARCEALIASAGDLESDWCRAEQDESGLLLRGVPSADYHMFVCADGAWTEVDLDRNAESVVVPRGAGGLLPPKRCDAGDLGDVIVIPGRVSMSTAIGAFCVTSELGSAGCAWRGTAKRVLEGVRCGWADMVTIVSSKLGVACVRWDAETIGARDFGTCTLELGTDGDVIDGELKIRSSWRGLGGVVYGWDVDGWIARPDATRRLSLRGLPPGVYDVEAEANVGAADGTTRRVRVPRRFVTLTDGQTLRVDNR